MPSSYSKPALTYNQQVALLRERGMQIEDEAKAVFYLQHINYYRLSAYWLPFEEDLNTHQFRQGTQFEDVLSLYIFDRELRLLIMDAFERVEVSVRAQWAFRLGHDYGSHGYLDPNLGLSMDRCEKNITDLENETKRSQETFIKHFKDTYTENLPPVWAACEVMSLGLLSHWYANLKPAHTKNAIADAYGLDEKILVSWLHHLTTVRNVCAHHSRLWNRTFPIRTKTPKTKPKSLIGELTNEHRIYNTLVILLYLLDIISPNHGWRRKVKKFFSDHEIPLVEMGFPNDWQERQVWGNSSIRRDS